MIQIHFSAFLLLFWTQTNCLLLFGELGEAWSFHFEKLSVDLFVCMDESSPWFWKAVACLRFEKGIINNYFELIATKNMLFIFIFFIFLHTNKWFACFLSSRKGEKYFWKSLRNCQMSCQMVLAISMGGKCCNFFEDSQNWSRCCSLSEMNCNGFGLQTMQKIIFFLNFLDANQSKMWALYSGGGGVVGCFEDWFRTDIFLLRILPWSPSPDGIGILIHWWDQLSLWFSWRF